MYRGAEPSLLQSLALQLADKGNYKITEPLRALSLADRCVKTYIHTLLARPQGCLDESV